MLRSGEAGLKKNFQNGILLLTRSHSNFYNHLETGGGWLNEVEASLRGRKHMQLRLQKSSEGGLYGHKKSWQDQEESPGKEKGRGQEEEVVGTTLLEAIH